MEYLMVYLSIATILVVSLSLFGLFIYGVYHSFKAHIGWGVASIFFSPLAYVVGTIKLVTNKNILMRK